MKDGAPGEQLAQPPRLQVEELQRCAREIQVEVGAIGAGGGEQINQNTLRGKSYLTLPVVDGLLIGQPPSNGVGEVVVAVAVVAIPVTTPDLGRRQFAERGESCTPQLDQAAGLAGPAPPGDGRAEHGDNEITSQATRDIREPRATSAAVTAWSANRSRPRCSRSDAQGTHPRTPSSHLGIQVMTGSDITATLVDVSQ